MQDTNLCDMNVDELEEVRGGGFVIDAATWVEGAADSVEKWRSGVFDAVSNS